jgi:hypothetical protein
MPLRGADVNKIKLEFDGSDESKDRFSMLYAGFVMGGDKPGTPKGMAVTHRESAILDKFDAIGEDDTQAGKKLKTAGSMDLEPTEFEMLVKYFEAADYRTAVAQRVSRARRWLAEVAVAHAL